MSSFNNNILKPFRFRDNFLGNALDTKNWIVTQGNGTSATVSANQLTINAGTVANQEFILESIETFSPPFRVQFCSNISTKQANQEMYLEVISVDNLGNIDNVCGAAWLFDNTATATTKAKYLTWNGLGVTPVISSEVVCAWGNSIKEIEVNLDEVWFHEKTVDSSNSRLSSNVRHSIIPNSDKKYKVRIRTKNINSISPATNSTMRLIFVTANEFDETEINGSGAITSSQSIPVNISSGSMGTISTVTNVTTVGTVSAVSGTVNTTANLTQSATPTTDTTTNLTASAIYTGTTKDFTTAPAGSKTRVIVNHLAGTTLGHLAYEISVDNTNWKELYRVPVPSDSQFRIFEFPVIARYGRLKFYNGAVAQTSFSLMSIYIKSDGRVLNTNPTILHSATALAASATFNTPIMQISDTMNFETHEVEVCADQVGTLTILQSRDNTNWFTTKSQANVANTPLVIEDNLYAPYCKATFVNGATANTKFEIVSKFK